MPTVPSAPTNADATRHFIPTSQSPRRATQYPPGFWTVLSLVETTMFRYNTIIGRWLQARTPPHQGTEAKIGRNGLKRMTELGMPISVRVH
jgi:hypothetical protein